MGVAQVHWLALGYFLSYIPYVLLVKTMSSGATPLAQEPIGGLVLLPAAALGQLAVMPVLLGVTGWWRHVRRREIHGRHVPLPGRNTLMAGFFTALIISTTTLNFTFAGVSVLLMLLMMRGGVLILSPLVDVARKRWVQTASWIGLGFSLAAILTALGDVGSYHLTVGAIVSVLVYLIGYVGRFEIMSRVAKTGDHDTDRRYFVEEHASAPAFQALMLAIAALAGQPELRAGFTEFLGTPAAWGAVGIGVAYEVLFVFGSLIYLDRREYTWCVPANRCVSLISGLVASYALAGLAGLPLPGTAQLLAFVFIISAVVALSSPALAARWRARGTGGVRRVLFVCGGNTSRSPMAEAIARAQAAQADPPASGVRFTSAGVTTTRPGAPMTPSARSALAELGIQDGTGHGWRRGPDSTGHGAARQHRARPVTRKLCRDSSAIYCMTLAHRDALIALAPEVEGRTRCLDPGGDIPNPDGQPADAYRHCARHIQQLVRTQLHEILDRPTSVPPTTCEADRG